MENKSAGMSAAENDEPESITIVRVLAVIGIVLALVAIVINLAMFVVTVGLKKSKRMTLSIGGLIMLSSFSEILLNIDVINSLIFEVDIHGSLEDYIRCYLLNFRELLYITLSFCSSATGWPV